MAMNAGLLKYIQSKKKGGAVAPAQRFVVKAQAPEGSPAEEAQDAKEMQPTKKGRFGK